MTMLFLAWLAVSFLVVAVINLYLRHFGLPRGQGASGSTVIGKVSSTSSVLSHYSALSTVSGLVSSVGHGESANWINNIVTWIYHRAPSSGHRIELLDTWLKSLTEHAEHQSREVRVKFDDVHGSPPEFTNFSVDPASAIGGPTGVASSGLNLYMTTTARDITLQVCILIQNVDSTRTIYADVYILHLQGQIKVMVSPTTADGDTPIQVSFVSTPELRLQILPSGRLNASTDLSSVEAIVKAALYGAAAKFIWSSSGGFRSSQSSKARTQQQTSNYTTATPSALPVNQQATFGLTPQQSFPGPQSAAGYGDLHQQQQILSNASQQQFSLPLSPQQHQPQLQQHIQHQQLQQQQQQQPYVQHQQQQQQQFFPQQQPVQLAAPPTATTSRSGDLASRSVDVSLQDSFNSRTAERLLVKVIKANGLADDLGNCNAYCVVRVDRPAQNFMTGVIRNTVNPMWDEQFVLDTDSFTRQIQFDILDRDKPPDSELLGKAVVNFDEVRRMPSIRQILPLTGRLRSRTATSGSVTVEFVVLDATESIRGTSQQTIQLPNTGTGNIPSNADQLTKPNVSAGDYGAFQNRLSAHDLALSQQVGSRQQESPTLVVTGTENQRPNVAGTLDGRGRGHEPKESFASALKKRLTRGGKKRSQSADRAKLHSQSLHEGGSYLRPPGDSSYGYRTTDTVMDETGERKARSNSFTSSLRRIFKPSQSGKKDVSREGSLTRPDTSGQYQSQLASYGYDRSIRQSTPVPPGADRRGQDQYGNTPSAAVTLTSGADRRGQDQYSNTLQATTTLQSGADRRGHDQYSNTLSTTATVSVGRY